MSPFPMTSKPVEEPHLVGSKRFSRPAPQSCPAKGNAFSFPFDLLARDEREETNPYPDTILLNWLAARRK